MLENILMIALGLMVIGASFLIGFFVGLSNALDMMEEKDYDDEL